MSTPIPKQVQPILGVPFFTGSCQEAVQIGLKGGLIVAPAAPALVDMRRDPAYRDALLESDLALTDSGFMVLVWNLLSRASVTRISGLEYLQLMLATPCFREPHQSFWVMATQASMERNLRWLRSRGVAADESDCYVAPVYGSDEVTDVELLKILRARTPPPDHHRPWWRRARKARPLSEVRTRL